MDTAETRGVDRGASPADADGRHPAFTDAADGKVLLADASDCHDGLADAMGPDAGPDAQGDLEDERDYDPTVCGGSGCGCAGCP